MDNDEIIVKGIIKKDEKAFTLLIDKYGGLIKAIVLRNLTDFQIYQDECINDVLMSIWQNIRRYDSSKNSLKNWIGAISKYKCIDYKRKYYKEISFVGIDENIPDDRDVFECVIKNEMQQEIISLLEGLKEQDKEMFYNHYILGEAIDEIAKNQGKSPSILYNRLSRARKKLRKNLQGSVFYEK